MSTVLRLLLLLLLSLATPITARNKIVTVKHGALGDEEESFLGIGFDLLANLKDNNITRSSAFFNEVYGKRLLEVRPGFVRMDPEVNRGDDVGGLNATLYILNRSNTSIYFTTFAPPYINYTKNFEGLQNYGMRVGQTLKQRLAVAPTARYYCWTNELSLCLPWDCNWGSLVREKRFDIWQAYHEAMYKGLVAAGIENQIGLLATDASPTYNWVTMNWAMSAVDNITAVYGGHHYPNNFSAKSNGLYKFWLGQVNGMAGRVQEATGKKFLIGETGGPQWTNTHTNKSRYGCDIWDGCAWFDTPEEPYGALQLVEQAIGAINGNAISMGWWTFFSQYIEPGVQYAKCNDWGTSRWNGTDTRPRMHYAVTGLVSRYFHGPACKVEVTTDNELIRVATIGSMADSWWSTAVVSRDNATTTMNMTIPIQSSKPIRVYSYSVDLPLVSNDFGDLPPASKVMNVSEEHELSVQLPPFSITIFTTNYNIATVPQVGDVQVSRINATLVSVHWTAIPDPTIFYYRVYLNGTQIRSTMNDNINATSSIEETFSVRAVDMWGNEGL
eukprot:m.47112 g.47112  ORF g.47112 m.47112 type:complete len:556 (-) comp10448_c0_seq2:97-1764(-)